MFAAMLALVVALQLPAAPPALAPELEQEARRLETKVIAVCCWSQQVSVHDSPAATQMRLEIRRRLADGQDADAILAAFVAEHGERVLAEPPARGFTRLLYVAPPVLGVLGIGLLVVVIRRFAMRGAAAPAAAGATLAGGNALDRRLDEELRDLD
jgi:cytochrome c-type biogenesis protein CcmH/NrfF